MVVSRYATSVRLAQDLSHIRGQVGVDRSLHDEVRYNILYACELSICCSLPYAIRFRQCVVEYIGSGRKNPNSLANAVKYATAFPVIFLSAMQIIPEGYDDGSADKSKWRRDNNLWALWCVTSAGASVSPAQLD